MAAYEQGDYIKVEFKDDDTGESEWMWVRVDYADDEERVVFGRLDNAPVVIKGLRLGMELAVSYGNIREHRKSASSGQA
jgi:uncharacterized protein YegJ (DUF2314 family)